MFESMLGRVESLDRGEARVFARRCRALVDAAALARDAASASGVEEFLLLELAGSCRVSQGRVRSLLVEAELLVGCLPVMLALLEEGRVLVGQAREVLRGVGSCPDVVAREVDRRLWPASVGLNAVDLRRRVAREVLRVETELDGLAAERRTAARAARGVSAFALPDGMAGVSAVLPVEAHREFCLGLDALARRAKAADRAAGGVVRSMDQARADVFASLPALVLSRGWDGGGPGPRVVVNVHVPMASALGVSEDPGTVEGYGPVPADLVRRLLPDAVLRRIAVDPVSGVPVAADARTHRRPSPRPAPSSRPRPAPGGAGTSCPERGGPDGPGWVREVLAGMLNGWEVPADRAEPGHDPSAGLGRFIDLRDPVCTGPGCQASVGRLQRDHLLAWPAGPTAAWNLKNHSARCHRAKHHGWTVTVHPDGATSWTSPHGRTYTQPAWHHPPPALPGAAALPGVEVYAAWADPPPTWARPPGWADEDPLLDPPSPPAGHGLHRPPDPDEPCPF